MTLGRAMIDIAGLEPTAEEKERLSHPQVGGLILFARNFESPAQLRMLAAEVRTLREPQLLIAVDHEGGRVQRFRQGFTRIPPMRSIGACGRDDGARLARAAGLVIAAELQAHGVDFSFAPVLDVDHGASSVIGDRAFCGDAAMLAHLAGAFVEGLTAGGMAAVGKHYPGHGYASADSHVDMPVDERSLEAIEASDLVPYRELIGRGLAAVMPAHVVYPKVDGRPAGFSPVWLRDILRARLGFQGMIFSDDLSMEAATQGGGVVERARAALAAGCDMVLLCNAPDAATKLIDGLDADPVPEARAARMRGRRLMRPAAAHAGYAGAVSALSRAIPEAA
ncbi:MAG TPA: beta-N-acetylhexosaminidase [Burkholderiales bacterium]|nr:beta-N-acetylhexosaminidase [Burkholderiales bacterium]